MGLRPKCKNWNHNLLEEKKKGNTVFEVDLSNNFLDVSPQARVLRGTNYLE